MVDEVHIVGSDLPAWATEKTLTDLVVAIKELKNLTSSQGDSVKESLSKMASGKGGDSKDALSEMERIFSNNKAGQDESIGNVHNSLKDAASDLEQTSIKSKIYNSVIDNGEAVMFKFGKSLGLSSVALGSLETAAFALVGKFIELTIGGVKASLDMYMDLYKSGILYNNMVGSATHGLGVLGQAASNAGMPVLMMGDLIKKYNTTMGRFGVEGFGMIAQKTQALGAVLGLSASESADGLAEYMDNQRKAGTLSTMTMEQVQKNAAVQIRTTMDFAREMGTTTDVLKESQRKIADSAEFKAGLATIPMEIRAKMGNVASQILAMFDAKGMGDAGNELMQVMAKGQLARGDKFITDMMSLGPKGSQVAEQIMQLGQSFKDGNISQEEMMKRSKDIMASMGDMSKDPRVGQFMAQMGVAGQDMSKYASLFAAGAEAQADMKSGKTKHDDEIAKSMANMKTVWDRFTNIFSEMGAKLFGNTEFVEAFKVSIGLLSDKMMALIPILEKNMPMIIDFIGRLAEGTVEFITNIAEGKSIFSDLKSWMETLGIVFGVLFIGLGNIVTVVGWVWKALTMIGPALTWLADGVMVMAGTLGTTVAALLSGIMLGIGIFMGIVEGIKQFDLNNIGLSIANIFVQIGNVFIRAAGDIYYWIKEKLYGLLGSDKDVAEVQKQHADFSSRYSSENNTLLPQSIEKDKTKEQVGATTTATQEAKAEEKTKEKAAAQAVTKQASKAHEPNNKDDSHAAATDNKINKGILDASKYANALFEVMNGHLAAIEKNTKMVSTAGHF